LVLKIGVSKVNNIENKEIKIAFKLILFYPTPSFVINEKTSIRENKR